MAGEPGSGATLVATTGDQEMGNDHIQLNQEAQGDKEAGVNEEQGGGEMTVMTEDETRWELGPV